MHSTGSVIIVLLYKLIIVVACPNQLIELVIISSDFIEALFLKYSFILSVVKLYKKMELEISLNIIHPFLMFPFKYYNTNNHNSNTYKII